MGGARAAEGPGQPWGEVLAKPLLVLAFLPASLSWTCRFRGSARAGNLKVPGQGGAFLPPAPFPLGPFVGWSGLPPA